MFTNHSGCVPASYKHSSEEIIKQRLYYTTAQTQNFSKLMDSCSSLAKVPTTACRRWADCEDDFEHLMTAEDIDNTGILKLKGLPHRAPAEFRPEPIAAAYPEHEEEPDALTSLGLAIGGLFEGRTRLPQRLSAATGGPRRGGAKKCQSVRVPSTEPLLAAAISRTLFSNVNNISFQAYS